MAPGKLAEGIACLAVVQENLAVGSDTRKMVPAWRVSHVVDEVCVRMDHLWPGEGLRVRARALVSHGPP